MQTLATIFIFCIVQYLSTFCIMCILKYLYFALCVCLNLIALCVCLKCFDLHYYFINIIIMLHFHHDNLVNYVYSDEHNEYLQAINFET